jgi:hypothetical protein
MMRIDEGTANLASPLQALLKQIADALNTQGFLVSSVALSDLYVPQPVWASTDTRNPVPESLATVLRLAAASRPATQPTSCTTDALLAEGSTLSGWISGNIRPFSPGPGALMVVLIDSGARPHPLAECRSDDFSNADPIRWAQLDRILRIRQTLFLMLATSESGDLSGMRQRCGAIPGFPMSGLDVLAPSSNAFFDPWAAQMNGRKPELANRIDLCDALGSGAPALWQNIAKRWFSVLETLR